VGERLPHQASMWSASLGQPQGDTRIDTEGDERSPQPTHVFGDLAIMH
jgi:hypothetical protein